MKRILIIEDNPGYREGADKYFGNQGGIDIAYAIDYDQAMPLLAGEPRQDGAISDVFFPKKTGSGDISLGKLAIEKMRDSDPIESARKAVLEKVGQYAKIDDELKEYLINFADGYPEKGKVIHNPTIWAIERAGKVLAPEAVALIVKNTLKVYMTSAMQARRDYYGALEKAIQESEANQPLGILIGERAEELGIPFVLATSTYHHDMLTQPVQYYAFKKRWPLIDCDPAMGDDKAKPEFWKMAFNVLLGKSIK